MRFDIYVDGSYSDVNMPDRTKGGYVIVDNGKAILGQHVYTKIPNFVSMRNVGGELLSAMCALSVISQLLKEEQIDEQVDVYIYHDYKGISTFFTGEWNANKEGPKIYKQTMQSIKREHNNLNLKFIKVKGHSNNKFNDVADALAANASYAIDRDKRLEDFELKLG